MTDDTRKTFTMRPVRAGKGYSLEEIRAAADAGPGPIIQQDREPMKILELSGGAQAIAEERMRQVQAEGWTPEHDDEHRREELTKAAVAYVVYGGRVRFVDPPFSWPWDAAWWKPKDRRSDLVRAGALIAAEIDRLDRLAEREKGA